MVIGEERRRTSEDRVERVVGVIVASGDAYLAVRNASGGTRPSVSLSRVQIADQMTAARGLRDLGARLEQELRNLGPSEVKIVEPRPRKTGWTYADAFKKASVETMVMTAAANLGLPVSLVKPSRIEKELGLPKEKPENELKARLAAAPKYWSTAWLAVGAVLAENAS